MAGSKSGARNEVRDSGSGKGRPDGSSSKSEETDPSESPNYRRLDEVSMRVTWIHTWNRFMVRAGEGWAMDK